VIPSPQHPPGLLRAPQSIWGPADRLTNQRGSGEARRLCGDGAGSARSRGEVGAPHSTAWCLWGRRQGDGDRLFPALPGGRVTWKEVRTWLRWNGSSPSLVKVFTPLLSWNHKNKLLRGVRGDPQSHKSLLLA